MNKEQKENFILKLDEDLLVGGVVLSEWSVFLIKDADLAFLEGAHLAALITSLAGIETHLRYEYAETKKERLCDLINKAVIEKDLREELHILRDYRNKWVHITDPSDDVDLLDQPEVYEKELEEMSERAIKALRQVIYSEQWL